MIIVISLKEETDPQSVLSFFADFMKENFKGNPEIIAYAYRRGINLETLNGTMTIAELEQRA